MSVEGAGERRGGIEAGDALVLVAAIAALVAVVVLGGPWAAVLVVVGAAVQGLEVLALRCPPPSVVGAGGRAALVRTLVLGVVVRWVPIGLLVAWAAAGPGWRWTAVVAFAAIVSNGPRDVARRDLWLLPDLVERQARSRRFWARVRTIAHERAEGLAQRPAADPSVAGRFVFVVCGGAAHVRTLEVAVEHLRAATDQEVWVLTDEARNELAIDPALVDRVVDVRAPAHLDHHQASIWLKTSVHRHLPPGEWCYLDSDIVAVAPGVEAVFAPRQAPVAFALDLTATGNHVDRFSPWAMTCACTGSGATFTCPHLREQLRARFDLDVPGRWTHWNGGVFAFGPGSEAFLDLWHERAVASFAWPEWQTRDQGTLISTVWSLGLQDAPTLAPELNFIADLANPGLCLDDELGWALDPAGPWVRPRLLHLFASPLDHPAWDLSLDLDAVVLRRSSIRRARHARGELLPGGLPAPGRRSLRWQLEDLTIRSGRFPRRLHPARLGRSVRRRLGVDVEAVPIEAVEVHLGPTVRSLL